MPRGRSFEMTPVSASLLWRRLAAEYVASRSNQSLKQILPFRAECHRGDVWSSYPSPKHSAILKFGLPVSKGHTETPHPWKHCGLVILWTPSLIQGAGCLCPGPAAPDDDPCGSRKTPIPKKALRRDLGLLRDSTESFVSSWQLRNKFRQMTLRIAERWLGTDKEWKMGKTKIFLKVRA